MLRALRTLRKSAILLLLPLSVLLLSGGQSMADGAEVYHFIEGSPGQLAIEHPDGRGYMVFNYLNDPGEFLRTNPDGSTWVHLAGNQCEVWGFDTAWNLISVGVGHFTLSGSAIRLGPQEFVADWQELTFNGTSFLTLLDTGEEFHWSITVRAHKGEVKVFKVKEKAL